MQDYLDSELDRAITSALYAQTRLRGRQRRLAWERVRAHAAQQAMLPPLEPVKPVLRCLFARRLGALARSGGRRLVDLVFDDTPYDRAMRQHRRPYTLGMLGSSLREVHGGVAT